MNEENRFPIILALILILVAIVLMVALRQVAVRLIVAPIMYFLWLLNFLFESLPQLFFWLFALFMIFRLALRSLHKPRQAVHKAQPLPRGPSEGRVLAWSQRLALTREGNYSKWGICRHLVQLYAEVLAFRSKIPLNEARNRLRHGEYDAPDDVRAYIEAGLSSQPPSTLNLWARLMTWLGLREPQSILPALNLPAARFVEFLENQLEVLYDVENN